MYSHCELLVRGVFVFVFLYISSGGLIKLLYFVFLWRARKKTNMRRISEVILLMTYTPDIIVVVRFLDNFLGWASKAPPRFLGKEMEKASLQNLSETDRRSPLLHDLDLSGEMPQLLDRYRLQQQ